MDLIILFLPLILLLGIITSYYDIKQGKIHNKWILCALIASIVVHSILFLFGIINLQYILKMLLVSGISLFIGFFIWIMGYWSAGDAKLLFAFTTLIPITSYANQNNALVYLLVNSFVPLFLFFILKIIFKTGFNQKIRIIKDALGWKKVLNYLLIIFGIGWLFNFSVGLIKMNIYPNFPQNVFISMMGIMIIAGLIQKMSKIKLLNENNITFQNILIVLCVIRVIFNFEQMLVLTFWWNFIIFTLLYAIVILIINEMKDLLITHVDINLLKEGMIPVDKIIKHGRVYKTNKISSYSQFSINDSIFNSINEGLTKKDIAKLKKLHYKNKIPENLIVQQTLAFAPFIFIGTLLTIFFGMDIISFLILIISKI